MLADTIVIPYNDPAALERVLAAGDVACFIVEPVMENIGICLPDPGYLQAVREITRRYGTLLIFDEVKTGITAGWGGATMRFGVEPDLITLAKSIGGGFPVGAFGGRQDLMDLITAGKVLHLGTYNGNPLVHGGGPGRAHRRLLPRARPRRRSPATTTSSTPARRSSTAPVCPPTPSASARRAASPGRGTRVRNYRDYKATDFDLAFAQWIHGINRGILLPPGLDEQWLISVMHTEAEASRYADVFAEFASELTASPKRPDSLRLGPARTPSPRHAHRVLATRTEHLTRC